MLTGSHQIFYTQLNFYVGGLRNTGYDFFELKLKKKILLNFSTPACIRIVASSGFVLLVAALLDVLKTYFWFLNVILYWETNKLDTSTSKPSALLCCFCTKFQKMVVRTLPDYTCKFWIHLILIYFSLVEIHPCQLEYAWIYSETVYKVLGTFGVDALPTVS